MFDHNNTPLLNTINIYKTSLQDWGSFLESHVFLIQVFSFVITTRYKLSASTVMNRRNRNKEWWEIRRHGMKYEYRDRKWFAFCNFCNLYQTSSKSSMKSRLRILETLKIPYFLKTAEHNIDALVCHHLVSTTCI